MDLLRLALAGFALRGLLKPSGAPFERAVWWDVGSVRTRQMDVTATLKAWGVNRLILFANPEHGHGYPRADLEALIAAARRAGADTWLCLWPAYSGGRFRINPLGVDLGPFAGLQLDVEEHVQALKPEISEADAIDLAAQCNATGKPWSITVHSGRLHPHLIRRAPAVYVQAYSTVKPDGSDTRTGIYGPAQFSARSVARVRAINPRARVVAGLAAYWQRGYVDLGLYPTEEAAMLAAYRCALQAAPAGVAWWSGGWALINDYAPAAFAASVQLSR